jgi:cation:H+ antiporter
MKGTTYAKIAVIVCIGVIASFVRIAGVHLQPWLALATFGGAVAASSVLLMWASDSARVDISSGVAIALVALVAVLPEYAIDLFFAYKAGHQPAFGAYAAANMTGANRLLLGLGWPIVALIFFLSKRGRGSELELEPHQRIDVGFLGVAGLYSLVIPLTRQLAWYDAIVLLVLFGLYLWRLRGTGESGEELIGVAAELVTFSRGRRWTLIVASFVFAVWLILIGASPFAHALLKTGHQIGIDEFLLVQWLAPIASEFPEFLVASIFAARGRGADALGILLASKVNQWTLLVGSLPLAYTVGGGGWSLALDPRQVEEVALTAAQTLLGVAVLVNSRLTAWEAASLFVLFAAQFFLPGANARLALASAYFVIAAIIFLLRRRDVAGVVRTLLSPATEAPAKPPV